MRQHPVHAASKKLVPGDQAIRWLIESFRRPYFFVHIPKCGGTSVGDALEGYYPHLKARDWRKKTGVASWSALHTFALVRRPYERLCSLYRYGRVASGGGALNDWIVETLGGRRPEAMDTHFTLSPASQWVTDEAGRPLVKLVCRLEEIDEDWPLIQKFTRTQAPLVRKNQTEQTAGATVADLDARSIEIIESYYAEDFENFGYGRLGEERLQPRGDVPLVGLTSAAYVT